MNTNLRPVELYYLASLAKRSEINLDHAVALVLFHLHNLGYLWVEKKGGGLQAPKNCDYLLPLVRNYEYLCLKAVTTSCSDSMIKAVEEYNFRLMLMKMGYLRQKGGIFFSGPPTYLLSDIGEATIAQYRLLDPASIFRIPTEIRSYVEIAARVKNAKMLSYAPLRMQRTGN